MLLIYLYNYFCFLPNRLPNKMCVLLFVYSSYLCYEYFYYYIVRLSVPHDSTLHSEQNKLRVGVAASLATQCRYIGCICQIQATATTSNMLQRNEWNVKHSLTLFRVHFRVELNASDGRQVGQVLEPWPRLLLLLPMLLLPMLLLPMLLLLLMLPMLLPRLIVNDLCGSSQRAHFLAQKKVSCTNFLIAAATAATSAAATTATASQLK